MTDTSWSIHTDSNGTLTAAAMLGETPQYSRGEEVSYTFSFDSHSTYTTVRDYLDYAGANATGTAVDHTPWYRDQMPSAAPVSSSLIGIEPSSDLKTNSRYEGVWGIIKDGSDETNPTHTSYEIELTIFVLDAYSSGTRTDMQNSYQA